MFRKNVASEELAPKKGLRKKLEPGDLAPGNVAPDAVCVSRSGADAVTPR